MGFNYVFILNNCEFATYIYIQEKNMPIQYLYLYFQIKAMSSGDLQPDAGPTEPVAPYTVNIQSNYVSTLIHAVLFYMMYLILSYFVFNSMLK